MKRYTTIYINNILEKESIELIWSLISNEDISSFSIIKIKLNGNIIKSVIFENDYGTIEKRYENNRIKMKKKVNTLYIYIQQDLLLMSESI